MNNISCVVFAAGKGTRMNIDIAKCAYPFLDKPMILRIVEEIKKISNDICVVVGYKKEDIKNILNDNVQYAYQKEQNGTADALLSSINFWKNKKGILLILLGDTPLVDSDIIKKLINTHINEKNDMTVITTILDNPTGYGRIIKENNIIKKIKEEKELDNIEKQINEINTGIYAININILEDALLKINNNNKNKEYYLTDIVEILSKDKKVGTCFINEKYKLEGVNDLKTLTKLENIIKNK